MQAILLIALLPARIPIARISRWTVCIIAICILVNKVSADGYIGPLLYKEYGSHIGIAYCQRDAIGAIEIPATIVGKPVTEIENSAFSSCISLSSVAIPPSMISIGHSAFSQCINLTEIAIPMSVTGIQPFAFYGCTRMTTITVESANNFFSSADGVLFNKNQTTLISCPAGKSGNYTIPSSVTSIGSYAFTGCAKLTEVAIQGGVTYIDTTAFTTCPSLTSIMVDPTNSVYSSSEGVLFNKNQASLIRFPEGKSGNYAIPNSVTSLEPSAFRDSSLTNVTIPTSISGIPSYTFLNCTNLETVVIPPGVTSIGAYAFYGCSSMTSAYFYGNAPSIATSFFDGTPSVFTIYYFNDRGFTSPKWWGYNAINMGPLTPVAKWLIDKGIQYNADLNSDENSDGVNLLMAYALNLDPKQNLSGRLPKPEYTANQMKLRFYAGSEGVAYSAQSSTDLQSWSDIGLSAPDVSGFRTATVSSSGPSRFMRLVISQ